MRNILNARTAPLYTSNHSKLMVICLPANGKPALRIVLPWFTSNIPRINQSKKMNIKSTFSFTRTVIIYFPVLLIVQISKKKTNRNRSDTPFLIKDVSIDMDKKKKNFVLGSR